MTNQEKWLRAVVALRADGVKFRSNVRKCCRGCITYEDLSITDPAQPYGYTYGGQGNRISWDSDGNPTRRVHDFRKSRDEFAERIYVNWGNGAAEKIVVAFTAAGLDATWNGSEHSCVIVTFTA